MLTSCSKNIKQDLITKTTQIYEATTSIIEETTVVETNELPTNTDKILETIHSHSFKLTDEIKSTCTKNGQKIFSCECGKQEIEILEQLTHEYILIETNDSVKIYCCLNCNDSYEEKIIKPKAIDTDLCGESLIEKILPHALYQDLMSITFDLYHSHYNESDYDSIYVLSEGMHYTQLQQLFFTSYRYLGENIHFFGSHNEEGTPCIRVYCKTEEDEQAKIVYNEANRILEELNITNSTTQKEAITRINDWICKQKEYDYSALDDVTKLNSSMYYSLFSDKGVCMNYAIAFQILCLSAGIECHYYSSSTMNHAWNKVYFSDGSYSWVDVTWNDTINTTKYLLITDEQLLKDHTL